MIDKMRFSGQNVASILESLNNFIKPGITTEDINEFCRIKISELNGVSGAFGYFGFPKHVCTSVNNVVCHGIPSKTEVLKIGDIISVDIAAKFNDYFGDSCFTYEVGEISNQAKKVKNTAYESMWNAIMEIKPGANIRTLGQTMEKTAKKQGFSTVKYFCGHGIGKNMHQDPQVPFYDDPYCDFILESGQFITIEPMINENGHAISILKDEWTAVTKDKGLSAQFEHTIAVIDGGFEVMTYNF